MPSRRSYPTDRYARKERLRLIRWDYIKLGAAEVMGHVVEWGRTTARQRYIDKVEQELSKWEGDDNGTGHVRSHDDEAT